MPLLVQRNSFLVLDLDLEIVDGVRCLKVQGGGLACDYDDEDDDDDDDDDDDHDHQPWTSRHLTPSTMSRPSSRTRKEFLWNSSDMEELFADDDHDHDYHDHDHHRLQSS